MLQEMKHFYIKTFLEGALSSLDDKVVGKWKKYFTLKSDFYISYVSIFNQGRFFMTSFIFVLD